MWSATCSTTGAQRQQETVVGTQWQHMYMCNDSGATMQVVYRGGKDMDYES